MKIVIISSSVKIKHMYFALCSLKHRKYDIDVNFITHKRDKTFIFFVLKLILSHYPKSNRNM